MNSLISRSLCNVEDIEEDPSPAEVMAVEVGRLFDTAEGMGELMAQLARILDAAELRAKRSRSIGEYSPYANVREGLRLALGENGLLELLSDDWRGRHVPGDRKA